MEAHRQCLCVLTLLFSGSDVMRDLIDNKTHTKGIVRELHASSLFGFHNIPWCHVTHVEINDTLNTFTLVNS